MCYVSYGYVRCVLCVHAVMCVEHALCVVYAWCVCGSVYGVCVGGCLCTLCEKAGVGILKTLKVFSLQERCCCPLHCPVDLSIFRIKAVEGLLADSSLGGVGST